MHKPKCVKKHPALIRFKKSYSVIYLKTCKINSARNHRSVSTCTIEQKHSNVFILDMVSLGTKTTNVYFMTYIEGCIKRHNVSGVVQMVLKVKGASDISKCDGLKLFQHYELMFISNMFHILLNWMS